MFCCKFHLLHLFFFQAIWHESNLSYNQLIIIIFIIIRKNKI